MNGEIVAATTNRGKVRELRAALAKMGIAVVAASDLGLDLKVEETGETFEQNAVLKAEAYRDASGRTALADDSGLEVAALGGAPGALSARFGGPGLDDTGRVRLLLAHLAGETNRAARFVTCLALAVPGEPVRLFRGEIRGVIAISPSGAGGFGYDPIFIPAGEGRTFAEMTVLEKERISHRGRAVSALLDYLSTAGGGYTEP